MTAGSCGLAPVIAKKSVEIQWRTARQIAGAYTPNQMADEAAAGNIPHCWAVFLPVRGVLRGRRAFPG